MSELKLDILSSVKDIQKDDEKDGDHARTDTTTSVNVTAITDLCDIEWEAPNFTSNALLPHHVHYEHVINLPVGVTHIPAPIGSSGNEKLLPHFLPLCNTHV